LYNIIKNPTFPNKIVSNFAKINNQILGITEKIVILYNKNPQTSRIAQMKIRMKQMHKKASTMLGHRGCKKLNGLGIFNFP